MSADDAALAEEHAAFLRRALGPAHEAAEDADERDDFASPGTVAAYLCPPERELTPSDFAALAGRPSADVSDDRAALADDERPPDARHFAAAFRSMRRRDWQR